MSEPQEMRRLDGRDREGLRELLEEAPVAEDYWNLGRLVGVVIQVTCVGGASVRGLLLPIPDLSVWIRLILDDGGEAAVKYDRIAFVTWPEGIANV